MYVWLNETRGEVGFLEVRYIAIPRNQGPLAMTDGMDGPHFIPSTTKSERHIRHIPHSSDTLTLRKSTYRRRRHVTFIKMKTD